MEQPAFSMSERQEGSANNPLEAREVPPRTVKHRGATARVAAFVNEAGRPVFMATIQGALDDLPDDVVTNALWYATKQGKVRRLDVGLYAPLDWTAPGINGNGMKVLGVTPEETREETQDDLCLSAACWRWSGRRRTARWCSRASAGGCSQSQSCRRFRC